MIMLLHWVTRLRLRHVLIAGIIGLALEIFGLLDLVFAAFWELFSPWGACGDGASESCLRQHPSVVGHIGQAIGTTTMWLGQALILAAVLGLVAIAILRVARRRRRRATGSSERSFDRVDR